MWRIALTSNPHDQHQMLATALFAAYVPWAIYRPVVLGGCVTDHALHGVIRVVLVSLWLVYILLVRAKNGTFSWSRFGVGVATGGAWLALGMTAYELSENRPIIDHAFSRMPYRYIINLAPTATISGLCAAFASSLRAAAIAGLAALLVQFVVFEVATLPLQCLY
jgi:hypothetical protein